MGFTRKSNVYQLIPIAAFLLSGCSAEVTSDSGDFSTLPAPGVSTIIAPSYTPIPQATQLPEEDDPYSNCTTVPFDGLAKEVKGSPIHENEIVNLEFLTPDEIEVINDKFLVHHNFERALVGQPELVWSEELAELAKERLLDMVRRDYFGHYDPNTEKNMLEAYIGGNYFIGENLGRSELGVDDGESIPYALSISKALVESPLHYNNIVNPKFKAFGAFTARWNGSPTDEGREDMVVTVFIFAGGAECEGKH